MASSKLKKENKASFLQNILMLMFSQVIIKVLGLVYKVIIVDVEGFGNTGNGYYSTGYQIYMILLALSSMGIPNVVSKLVSERIAKGDFLAAHRVFRFCITIFSTTGVAFALLLFFGADFIATDILKASGVKYTLMSLAPALAVVPPSAVMRGYFVGLGSMKATSSSLVIEQFFNCILSIGFVYACIGKDTAVMAAAGNLSTSCACIIAFLYLVLFFSKRRGEIKNECLAQENTTEQTTKKEMLKIILSVSIPISFSSLVSVLGSAIDTVTISRCVQNAFNSFGNTAVELEEMAMELYGILQKAETITHLPLAISATFCTAIVPAISAAIAKSDIKQANRKITSSLFINSLFIFPCMAGFMAIAEPILKLLYPSVPDGALVLRLLTISLPFSSINFILNGILYGIGKSHIPAIALTASSLLKLGLNVWLVNIPSINIYGAVLSTVIYNFIIFTVEFLVVRKHIKLEVDLVKCFVKPILSSALMGVIVYLLYILLKPVGNTVSTLVSIICGMLVYAVFVILSKNLDKEDLESIPMGAKIEKILTKFHLV
ncbi:MAG: polysaccharide biosynthesis protein [Ruminococcaceae bacterium]|nr:polysaccharide biosynthesis protein [Oscillospiraceae bacterium]